MAVLFIDLDGFKSINDSLGHKAGDQILVTIAKRLVGVLRESDTVARFGGDEFAVLVEYSPRESVDQIAQKLMVSICEPIELEDQRRIVTGSIGISTFPQDENPSAEELVEQADEAMYEAKRAGKNQYRIFASKLQNAA